MVKAFAAYFECDRTHRKFLGNIDLRDLRLKNSVLDKLDLPFGVVEGTPSHTSSNRVLISYTWITLSKVSFMFLDSYVDASPLVLCIYDLKSL